MNEFILFTSTFLVVFALGLQSQFVNNRFFWAAGANSLIIGAANLLILKHIPASTTEVIAYLLGGVLGIWSAMAAFAAYSNRKGRHHGKK